MKPASSTPFIISSVAEQHRLLGLPQPEHPLLSVVRFEDLKPVAADVAGIFSTAFYTIALKSYCPCKAKYGHHAFDFDQGVMTFAAPGQLHTWEAGDAFPATGWLLVVHPDFLHHSAVEQRLKSYGFFYYATHEALHLSPREAATLKRLFQGIRQEYESSIDEHSQELSVSYISLLLQYANRFYHRQFITRKRLNTDLLTRLDALLYGYLNGELGKERDLPTASYAAEHLHLSVSYLNDLLKKQAGQTTQQYIHGKVIDHAKGLLASSALSVSEIAYSLGFEYAQSFSKLFRQKTRVSPLQFRHSSN